MPNIPDQMLLIVEALVLVLAIVGILSQSGKPRGGSSGAVIAISWGLLLFDILAILVNNALFQLIVNGLSRAHGI